MTADELRVEMMAAAKAAKPRDLDIKSHMFSESVIASFHDADTQAEIEKWFAFQHVSGWRLVTVNSVIYAPSEVARDRIKKHVFYAARSLKFTGDIMRRMVANVVGDEELIEWVAGRHPGFNIIWLPTYASDHDKCVQAMNLCLKMSRASGAGFMINVGANDEFLREDN